MTTILTVTNPYGQAPELSQDDVFSLAGFTMCGPGLGKSVREGFARLAGGILQKHGPRAFEMPKRAAAIHEAGHAIINSVLGIQTTNVLIEPMTRGGKLYWIGYAEAPALAVADTPSTRVGPADILARSRTTYAGLVAELLFAGEDRREGSSLDEIIMSQLLADRAASLIGVEPEQLWREGVADWCENQLWRNREVHAEITAALMKRGRLKEKALRDLCRKVKAIEDTPRQILNAGNRIKQSETEGMFQ